MQFTTRTQFVDQVITGLDTPEKIRCFLNTLYACGYQTAGESLEDFSEWFMTASVPEIHEVLSMLPSTMGHWRFHPEVNIFSMVRQHPIDLSSMGL